MQRTNARLELESLETRMVPAFINGNALMILGGSADDAVVVTENHIANSIQVVQNGMTQTFSSSGITSISAGLGRGNNSFTYRLGGGSDFTDAKSIHVALGPAIGLFTPGANNALFDLRHDGTGGQAQVLANLSIRVNGSFGTDIVNAELGVVDNADVTLTTRLGLGDDQVWATMAGDLRNDADLVFDLKDSQNSFLAGRRFLGGNDLMFVSTGKGVTASIDDDASVHVTMKGASGNDWLVFGFEGELDGVLVLRMKGEAGLDEASAWISLDQRSDGELDVILEASRVELAQLLLEDNSGGDVTILNAQIVIIAEA
jgi:hypothetical protein